MNMAGNLGSFVTALAFPYLLAWTGTHVTSSSTSPRGLNAAGRSALWLGASGRSSR